MASLPPDRWARIDTLFEQALGRPAEERTAFLRAACGDDPVLYREVEALLASVPASARHFGESATDFAAPLLAGRPHPGEPADDPALGTIVGPYQIVRELGRGGMGTVYLAERADGAFEKAVALKLVKRGMDTDEVLARFRRERQILAGLDHPGIARLVDGGAAADGRPFLVMEVVHGEPLTAWADARRLDVDARLGLFLQAAEAVAYAHRRLVVHRDLKPSNILVTADGTDGTPGEGIPRVKLLDFGIARLLEEDDGLGTRDGGRRLTPAYAAPEQLRGDAVTTATDVYALGVVLYELVAGRRPYDVQGKALTEIERVLADPPPRPGAVLTPEAAEARRTTPERLARRLRGDLDTIVLRALHPDPERRYPTVQAMADDLRRHQQGERVQARPDTLGYRVRTVVRRHRVGVLATAVVALSLVGGLGAALWQARAAAQERDEARSQADRADQVTDFLVRVFEVADPRESGGQTLTAEEILQLGSARIESELADQPASQAALFDVVGRVYTSMGLYDEAAPFLERALALRRDLQARAEVAASLHALAELRRLEGDFGQAVALLREALALRLRLHGEAHADVAATLDALGATLRNAGQWDEAIQVLERALALRRRLPESRRDEVAATLHNLGNALRGAGRAEASLPLLREALATQRTVLGPQHADVAWTLDTYARAHHAMGDYATAEPLYREALAVWRHNYGDDHPFVAYGLNHLGMLLEGRGDLDEAEEYHRQALAIWRRAGGEDHPDVARSTSNLGVILLARGEPQAAAELFRQSLDSWQAFYEDDHPLIAIGTRRLADATLAAGDVRGAEPLYRRALDRARRAFPEGHPNLGTALRRYGELLLQTGRPAEAEPLLRDVLAIRVEDYGAHHANTAFVQMSLGACLLALERYAEAEPLLLAGYQTFSAQDGAAYRDRAAAAAAQLVVLYEAWGRPADAARYRTEADG